VAFFSDSFHGVDGVATTCRNIVETANAHDFPILAIHAGEQTRYWRNGSTEFLELKRSAIAFNIDLHLQFDLLLARHYARVLDVVRKFHAEVVHITGPGDVGITGARVAHELQLPLIAAWHTNLHEFAARRIYYATSPLPQSFRRMMAAATEASTFWACMHFYRVAHVVLAPNKEHMELVATCTGRLVFPMRRGVDTGLFSAAKRSVHDNIFRLGYVGRLCPEKNVRFLAELEQALRRDGFDNYRFLIVGEGGERAWLERKLVQADFTGELHGEFLARAYANMDLFVFPSETDTYGNVVAEAQASGVPAVVTAKGGPKYQVQDGVTGFVGADAKDFIDKTKRVVTDPKLQRSLREAARLATVGRTWDRVLDDLGDAYKAGLQAASAVRPAPTSAASQAPNAVRRSSIPPASSN
jgi:glycosyltransferase involved in cell wall biosynthesis